jgi:hypothetical protein
MNEVENRRENEPLNNAAPSENDETRSCPGCNSIFNIIELQVFWYFGALWLLAVITSGAGFLLTLMGVCSESTAWCHSFLNTNNQILTGLFTVINLYVLPGRVLRVWGLGMNGSPRGKFSPDRSLLAESYDPASFYQIPFGPRAAISFLLVTSSLCQFVNQGFHVRYDKYEEAMRWPGVFWNNIFFMLSLLTMVIAMGLEGFEDAKVRAKWPEKFPPTASVLITERLWKLCCSSSNSLPS